MKNFLRFCFLTLIVSGISGCKKDVEEAVPVNANVQLAVDENEVWFDVPYEAAEITMVNKATNNSYQLKADATGKIVLRNLVPGNYSINVSLQITAVKYTELTGVYREDDFYLNYALTDKSLYADEDFTITLIATETVGGFVIKQIYYAGSHTTDAALNRDNFIEIYNNSDEILYADSLVIALVYGKPNNNTDSYSLSNNQFDWSKSINMSVNDDANEDYIYAKGIFMIPSDGSGKKYPVAPGASVIVAGTAVNHAGSYQNNNGSTVGANRPDLTVDLSKADFEAWFYDYDQKINPGRTPLASDVDNPGVPNVEIFFGTSMRDMLFPPQARESFALMKVDPTINLDNLPRFAAPTMRNVTTSTVIYPQIPVRYILDAVELEAPVSTDRIPRRLPQRYDSGAVSVPGGPYSSQSIVRKTLKTVNGRRILKDTNNSANDFGYLQVANSSKGDASFIDQ